jgi:hypothetical protein
MWLAGATGFVLAAVIFVVLVVTGVVRSDDGNSVAGSDGSSGPSRAAITLPRTIGGFTWLGVKQRSTDGGNPGQLAAHEQLVDQRTSAALSAAHDGAAAVVHQYTDPSQHTFYTVLVVRDGTPPPVVGVSSAKLQGLAEPMQRIVRVGTAYCEIDVVRATPYGQTPGPDADDVASCQRSTGSLTVVIRSGVAHDPHAVVAFLDRVWQLVS